MGLKVTNNAFGTLNAGITSSATTIVLASGQGARFPSLGAGDYFYATLIDTSNNLEIVKVTARSTDTMTVVRGQDSTTARAYSTNDRFELRPTAAMLNEITLAAENALPKAGGTMTGDLVFSSGAIRLPGSITSDAQINFKNSNSSSDTYAKFPMNTQTIFLRPNGSGQLEFWSDGSGVGRVLGLDQNGRVTMPSQPAFHAATDNVYTMGASDFVFQKVWLNRGSGYNSSTGRFTAPVTGVYVIFFEGLANNSERQTIDVRFFINGSQTQAATHYQVDYGGSYRKVSMMAVVSLAAGDYIGIRVQDSSKSYSFYGDAGAFTSATGGGHTSFKGYLLG